MARRRALTLRVAVAATAAVLMLAGCSTTPTAQDQASADPAPQATATYSYTGCDQVKCEGTLAGAPYEIEMPQAWNGTLVIYSHGYRQPTDALPGKPVAAPGYDSGQKEIGQALLAQGYAIAGSAYKSNGWAVSDGVKAAEDLEAFFAAKIAVPQRVYAWGDSLGGLITQVLSERHPSWLSGTAPLCGVLAGVVPNMDLALDAAYAVKKLIYPKLKLTGYSSMAEAQQNLTGAQNAVIAAGLGGKAAQLLYIGAIGDAPDKTQDQDGSSDFSRLFAIGQGIITALTFSTVGRYDIEQRYGGNISGNAGTDYSVRISDEEAAAIKARGGDVAAFDKQLASGGRVMPDDAARAKAQASGGDPTGDVTVPTITMHTQYDQVAIVANETFFKNRYDRAERAAGLLQLFTSPPAVYPAGGTPYGAGHCNFTPQSRIGIIGLLDSWVRSGSEPGPDQISAALGEASGWNPQFTPGPWPEQKAR